MFFINGISQDFLPANDRGTQFGDGCFTTARIINGNVSLIDLHLQRLKKTCTVLHIPFSEWSTLQIEMELLAQENFEGVIKVIITRGSSNQGYSTANCIKPSRILSISAHPINYSRWRYEGIVLVLSPIRLGRNPILAGLKHLSRIEQVLIRTYLDQIDADEALVLDSDGYITECCSSNLFWRIGKDVFTPRLDQAGVNGVMRQFCLQKLRYSGFRAIEVSVGVDALFDAEEAIVCNSLLPIVPVRAYGKHRWSTGELYHFLSPLCQ